ncbi:MAG: hypothetical protein HYU69_13590 [Bacteroidetes bacterium]|nr:hypothetical protein [Bacteroidota bacterium]
MKPNLFQRGIWMKTSDVAATKTPEEYGKYMQKIAIVLIIIGLVLLAYDNRQVFQQKSEDKKTYSSI